MQGVKQSRLERLEVNFSFDVRCKVVLPGGYKVVPYFFGPFLEIIRNSGSGFLLFAPEENISIVYYHFIEDKNNLNFF